MSRKNVKPPHRAKMTRLRISRRFEAFHNIAKLDPSSLRSNTIDNKFVCFVRVLQALAAQNSSDRRIPRKTLYKTSAFRAQEMYDVAQTITNVVYFAMFLFLKMLTFQNMRCSPIRGTHPKTQKIVFHSLVQVLNTKMKNCRLNLHQTMKY